MQTFFITLNDYLKTKGGYPKPWSGADAEAFVEMAKAKGKEVYGDEFELDEKLATTFSKVRSNPCIFIEFRYLRAIFHL